MSPTHHALDGIAVVSEIVASTDPRSAAQRLKSIFSEFKRTYTPHPLGYPQSLTLSSSNGPENANASANSILDGVVRLMNEIRKTGPLVHQVRLFE